jgi:tetratricopeptide (TPR) repeat protein
VKLITATLVALFSAEASTTPSTTSPTGGAPAPVVSAQAPTSPTATLGAQLARLDELHRKRDDLRAFGEEQQLVQATLARAPDDYGVLWRAARFYYWLSDDPAVGADQRSKWGHEGWDLAEHAITVNPNDVAGHYWAAVCMGSYALGLGVVKALSAGLEGKFKERLKRAGELNPAYENGSINVAWGRFYDKLPWPKRDRGKAQELLEKVIQANPNNLRAKVFLASSLNADDHPEEAKKLIDEVAAAQPGKYDAAEEKRAKVMGARLMPDVMAKMK